LINDEDRGWFRSLLTQRMKKDFDVEYSDVITKETILFGDFMVPNADPKIYAEIDDFKLVC
jgi:dynein heavy chain